MSLEDMEAAIADGSFTLGHMVGRDLHRYVGFMAETEASRMRRLDEE